MPSESSSDTIALLRRIREVAPQDDVRLHNYLAALEESVERDTLAGEETQKLMAEYEEAYGKLTAPANRLAVFLRWVESEDNLTPEPDDTRPVSELAGRDAAPSQLAMIVLGDTEYVAQVDPKLDSALLKTGVRVRVNEAYAVVGVLPPTDVGSFVKVVDALKDGRLRVGGDGRVSEGRLVIRSEELAQTEIKSGDEVRLDATGRIAVEHSIGAEMQDYFMEAVPPIPWEKVGGQTEAIQLIRETIESPLLHPEIYARFEKKPIKGILLYGPPGCGKTLIGKAIAYNLTQEYSKRVGHEVKEYFMTISGPKILNMWLGETERIIREIFKTARDKAKEGRLVFIFMDEAESVLRTRSSGRYLNISNTVVPQFCAELDGLQSLENVVLVLTSNRPDYIDPAILRPERIDRKVKISRPDKDATAQIIGIYLHDNLPLDPKLVKKYNGDVDCARRDLIEGLTDFLWKSNKENEVLKVHLRNGSAETLHYSDLMSGALLKSVVDRAKDLAIKRAIADKKSDAGIDLEDLIASAKREFKENEIFPKSDTLEDWLQLLDYPIENVVTVKATNSVKGRDFSNRGVI